MYYGRIELPLSISKASDYDPATTANPEWEEFDFSFSQSLHEHLVIGTSVSISFLSLATAETVILKNHATSGVITVSWKDADFTHAGTAPSVVIPAGDFAIIHNVDVGTGLTAASAASSRDLEYFVFGS